MRMFNRLLRRLRPPMTDMWLAFDWNAEIGPSLGIVHGVNHAEAMRDAKANWPGHKIFLSRISQASLNKVRSELGLPPIDAISDSMIGC